MCGNLFVLFYDGKGVIPYGYKFIRERITQLRLQGVSECKMSYDLGAQPRVYQQYFFGKTLPSMTEFGDCEVFRHYADLSFFNAGALNPRVNRELWTHWSS